MAKDLNDCKFTGRLGKEPDTRYQASGAAVCNISIAVQKSWKKDGVKQERTTWVPVTAFGKLAEIMGQYLKSGSRVLITGEFIVDKWQDRDGNDRYTTKIIANDMIMLDSRPNPAGETGGTGQREPGTAPGAGSAVSNNGFDDDLNDPIPF